MVYILTNNSKGTRHVEAHRGKARESCQAKPEEPDVPLQLPSFPATASSLLPPSSLLSPSACYHLKTLPRGPTHSRVSWSLRLLRICRIGKCKVTGRGRGRKRASMRTSKGISSASSMQSSSQDENVVADKQQRGRGEATAERNLFKTFCERGAGRVCNTCSFN